MANTGTKVMDAPKQLSSADRDNMSALDMALYGKAMASEEDVVGSNVDFEDEDWKMAVETAKSGGVGSWFASRVDFRVNGTRIRGKKGYSVRGGVVPLFDGAAIDLKKAKLKAPKKNEARSDSIGGSPDEYQNWVEGTGGQLVLAPFDAQNVVPFRMDQIVVTEKGVMGKSDKSFRFVRGDEEITGSSLVLRGDYAVLYGVRAEKGNEKEAVHERAAVTRAGLWLYYLPKPEEGRGQETVPEEIEENVLPEKSPDAAAESHDRGKQPDDSETQTPPETSGKVESLGDTIISSVQDFGSAIGTVETAIGPVQILADLEAGSISLTADSNSDEGEGTLADALAQQVKLSASQKLEELIRSIGNKSESEVETGTLEEIRNLMQELRGEELSNAWASLPNFCRNYFYGKMSESEVLDFTKSLLPWGPLRSLLGTDGEEETAVMEAKGEGAFPLAYFPIFDPFLGFNVTLKPDYSFGAYIKGDARGLYNIWKSGEGKTTDIFVDAGLKGHLSLEADAMLKAGINYILNLNAGLYAKAELAGSLTDARTFLAGKAKLSFKKLENGEIVLAENVKAMIDGGLKLTGSVGAKGGISSDILSWNKNLFTIEFGKWNLADMSMHLRFEKNKEEKNIFSGWSMKESDFNVEIIKQKFINDNPSEEKYGLYDPNTIGEKAMAGYEDAGKAFTDALDFLKIYRDRKDHAGMVTQGGAGLDQVLDMGIQMQNKFLKAWATAQINLEEQRYLLKKLKSEKYQKNIEAAQKSIDKHKKRIESMNAYSESDKKGEIAPLEYYMNLDGKPGHGFKKAMRRKAEETVYTYENLLQYEKDRRDSLVKKHSERIELLQSSKSNKDKLKEYDGKTVYKHRAFLADTETLREYEEQRREKARKKKQLFIDQLNATKANDSKAFMKIFLKDKDTRKKTCCAELLQYGYPKLLLEYEEKKVRTSSKTKALMSIRDSQADLKGDKSKAVLSYLKQKKAKTQNLESVLGSDTYRMASAEDLIQFEKELMMQHGGAELEAFLHSQTDRTLTMGGQMLLSKPFLVESIEMSEKKEELKDRYKKWLDSQSTDNLKSYMTLDLLLYYEKQRIQKAEEKEAAGKRRGKRNAKAKHEKRKQWLDLRLMDVGAADPENAEELERRYVEEYFETFRATQVLTDIKNMELVDLQLVMTAHTAENKKRIAVIEEAKKKGASPRELWLEYEKSGGDKKEISKKQKEKLEHDTITLEDLERFERFAVSESDVGASLVNLSKDARHWNRFEKLSQMMAENKNYGEMLDAYQAMGGGKGFAEYIKSELAARTLKKENGDIYQPDDIIHKETEFKIQMEKKHQDRLDLIDENKDKSYLELLSLYNSHIKQEGQGLHAGLRRPLSSLKRSLLSGGFEKSLSRQAVSPERILAYERMREKELREKHDERILKLEGDGAAPTEEEQQERLQEYMRTAKGYKKDAALSSKVKEEEQRLLNKADSNEMLKNILEYETGRKESYEGAVKKLTRPIGKAERAIKDLTKQRELCTVLVNNMTEIKNNPNSEWVETKFDQFEKMAAEVQSYKEREEELKTIGETTSELTADIAEREQANRQLEEILRDDET